MTTEQMLTQMAEDEDRKISEAWPIYWKLLERIESGVELNANERQQLMESAKLLERKERMSRDAQRVRDMLIARKTLARVTDKTLGADKAWVETETKELHEELRKFQARQFPKAVAVEQRQQKWETDRAARGQAAGELERFSSFIAGGPDSPAAQY